MINMAAQFFGLAQLSARFAAAPGAQRQRTVAAMRRATALVQQQAADNIARLFNHPAKMQSALSTRVDDSGASVVGTITASGLPYLRAQEYGATIQLPDIFPVNASVLHWIAPAKLGFSGGPKGQADVFSMFASAHPVTLPERSYMRAALAQRRAEVIAEFQGTMVI
jgi:hypothetical protein